MKDFITVHRRIFLLARRIISRLPQDSMASISRPALVPDEVRLGDSLTITLETRMNIISRALLEYRLRKLSTGRLIMTSMTSPAQPHHLVLPMVALIQLHLIGMMSIPPVYSKVHHMPPFIEPLFRRVLSIILRPPVWIIITLALPSHIPRLL